MSTQVPVSINQSRHCLHFEALIVNIAYKLDHYKPQILWNSQYIETDMWDIIMKIQKVFSH